MKCPHDPVECEYLITMDLNNPVECLRCPHYCDPIIKLTDAYSIPRMMNMLPKSLTSERKVILFKYKDIFDLNISKDGMDNWVVIYINDMSMKTLFITQDQDIHRCLAKMLILLIESKYI
jgi:hypothetical protein